MRVKKIRTISLYDIGKMESYLSDMAKVGLFINGFGQIYNVFTINEPADMEYRIELGETVLSKEIRERYEQSGWSYTCSIKRIHIFQAEVSDALVEIHIDPTEQSDTFRNCCKTFARLISLEIVLALIMIALAVFITLIGNTPVLNMLENNFIYIINVALVIFIILEIIRQMYTLVRIKKRLKMGFRINHHEPWKKRSISLSIAYGFIAVLAILSIASITCNIRTIVGFITGNSNYAVTFNMELPVVRLNDVEKLESPVLETYFPKSNHLLSNVRLNYNVFMNEMEVNEEFVQEDMTWEGDIYKPSIHTNYYKVYLPFMVQGALSDVLYKAENYFMGLPNDKIKVEKLDCNGLDEVYYIPEDGRVGHYFGIVARKNNTIIWMIYCGQKTRTEVMEATQSLFE